MPTPRLPDCHQVVPRGSQSVHASPIVRETAGIAKPWTAWWRQLYWLPGQMANVNQSPGPSEHLEWARQICKVQSRNFLAASRAERSRWGAQGYGEASAPPSVASNAKQNPRKVRLHDLPLPDLAASLSPRDRTWVVMLRGAEADSSGSEILSGDESPAGRRRIRSGPKQKTARRLQWKEAAQKGRHDVRARRERQQRLKNQSTRLPHVNQVESFSADPIPVNPWVSRSAAATPGLPVPADTDASVEFSGPESDKADEVWKDYRVERTSSPELSSGDEGGDEAGIGPESPSSHGSAFSPTPNSSKCSNYPGQYIAITGSGNVSEHGDSDGEAGGLGISAPASKRSSALKESASLSAREPQRELRSSALSSKRSSTVPEDQEVWAATIPEEERSAVNSKEGGIGLNQHQLSQAPSQSQSRRSSAGGMSSISQATSVTSGGGSNPASLETRWEEWRIFFALDMLDAFSEVWTRFPQKEGGCRSFEPRPFNRTFVDITGITVQRFDTLAYDTGIGVRNGTEIQLHSLHEFLDLMHGCLTKLQKDKPQLMWGSEELDSMETVFSHCANNHGHMRSEQFFTFIQRIGYGEMVQSQEQQRWFADITRQQLQQQNNEKKVKNCPPAGWLKLDQVLHVLSAALLEQERAGRRQELERERAARRETNFTLNDMDDLRELHRNFCKKIDAPARAGTVDRMKKFLEQCGMQLTTDELKVLREIVTNKSEKEGTDDKSPRQVGSPAFEDFVRWMYEIFRHDLHGITNLMKIGDNAHGSPDAKNQRSSFVKTMLKEEELLKARAEKEASDKKRNRHRKGNKDSPTAVSSSSNSALGSGVTSIMSSLQTSRRSSNSTGNKGKPNIQAISPEVAPAEAPFENEGVLQLKGLPSAEAMLGRAIPRAISAEDSGDEIEPVQKDRQKSEKVQRESPGEAPKSSKSRRKVKERPDPVKLVNAAIANLEEDLGDRRPKQDENEHG